MKKLTSRPLMAISLAAIGLASAAAPAVAQDAAAKGTVFDGDYLIVGGGAVYGPSYDGSNDYVIDPVPAIQGRLFGIGINAKNSGLSLDFINDGGNKISFAFGPSARLRSNRAVHIKDPVVEQLGTLKRAIEVGGTAGVGINKLITGYDTLSFGVDVRKDINGSHGGWVINPSVSYFTPLSKGIAVVLGADAEHADDKFMNYYFSVTPAGSLATGGVLPAYRAHGGWRKIGGSAIAAFDLDGDLTNGGLSIVAFGSYYREINDAEFSPIVSVRGSVNQWNGGLGLALAF
ncbi:MAG: structural protein MipA [Novosphingobium sp.]|nr:structural protein MipA [Novosphingobium sp.]